MLFACVLFLNKFYRMQDVSLSAGEDEKGFMARPTSSFCPDLNYIQMDACRHSSGVCEKHIRGIWNTSSSKTWGLACGHCGEIE